MYLQTYGATSVILYLITHPIQRGRQSMSAIGDMETWLIGVAHEVNPHLINKQGTRTKGWGIAGLIRGGRGKRSQAAVAVRELLGLDQDSPSPPESDEKGDPPKPKEGQLIGEIAK